MWTDWMARTKVERIAEIGVWRGEFAESVLLANRNISEYIMVDPWAHLETWNKPLNVSDTEFESVFEEAKRRTAFAADKITILRGTTKQAINSIADHSLDFAYIDGDHTLRGIAMDLVLILPKIKEGGYIGGDDFCENPWQHHMNFEPTMVSPFAAYFAEAMNFSFLALPFNQFLFKTTADQVFALKNLTGRPINLSLRSFFGIDGIKSELKK